MSYYLSVGGRNKGPYELETIESEFHAGRINGTTLCWTDSWPSWRPIAEAFPEWSKARLQQPQLVISSPTDRPGVLGRALKLGLVLLAGAVTSCLLGAGMALGEILTHYSIYGFMIWGVVPIGTICAGWGASAGSFFVARWLHYYPRLLFFLGVMVMAVSTLLTTHYFIYSHFGTDPARRTDIQGFEAYLVRLSHHVTLRSLQGPDYGSKTELGELSIWYYGLQVVGFCFGGLMTFSSIRSRRFCRRCQKYYARQEVAEFHENLNDVFASRFDQVRAMLRAGNYDAAQRFHPSKRSLAKAGFKKGFRSALTTFECPSCAERAYRHVGYAFRRNGGWSEIRSLTKEYPLISRRG